MESKVCTSVQLDAKIGTPFIYPAAMKEKAEMTANPPSPQKCSV